MSLLLYRKIADLGEEVALFWDSPCGVLWPWNRVTGDRNSFVCGNLSMEPKLVGRLWFPWSAKHQRWAWLLATKAVNKPCFHPLKAALTFDILNNGNETTTVRRENNGVLTNGTKTDSDWPFRSEKKLRQKDLPPPTKKPTPWDRGPSKMVDPLHGGL